jgi:hypothetical protein
MSKFSAQALSVEVNQAKERLIAEIIPIIIDKKTNMLAGCRSAFLIADALEVQRWSLVVNLALYWHSSKRYTEFCDTAKYPPIPQTVSPKGEIAVPLR